MCNVINVSGLERRGDFGFMVLAKKYIGSFQSLKWMNIDIGCH